MVHSWHEDSEAQRANDLLKVIKNVSGSREDLQVTAPCLLHEVFHSSSSYTEHCQCWVLSKLCIAETVWKSSCSLDTLRLIVFFWYELISLPLTVHLQSLFLYWKELTRESLMLRAQHHRAAQHHQQHLLQKYLVKWKNYHQQCLGKKVRRISNLPSLWEVTGVGEYTVCPDEGNSSLGWGGAWQLCVLRRKEHGCVLPEETDGTV